MLNPRRDSNLLSFSLGVGGIVDLGSCRRAGVSDDKVQWLVTSGRWQYVYPRTIATFSGPVPYASRLQAAAIYGGSGAAVSHQTAGAHHGICARPEAIHLLVPYERDVDDQVGLVVHRSRTFGSRDMASSPFRHTTLERTVLDLLPHATSAARALGLVSDAIRTRRTSADRLRTALEAAPCTKWRRVVLEALPDMAAGAQSPLELRDAQIRRRHGLPQGRRQVRRSGVGLEYLDVLIEPFGVHIELDGRLGHDRATERWRDMKRDNRSELQRLRHLRYGWADVVDRPCEVAIEQATILRQQGWRGAFKRCRSCPDQLPAGL